MNINYVIVQEVDGKYIAHAETQRCYQNFKDIFTAIKSLDILHFFKSFKEAKEIAAFWNDCYKNNGTLMSTQEVLANFEAGLI